MSLRLSTGLVNKLMATGSFKTLFTGCFIDVYSGAQPATPNDVPTGTKLVTLYSDGTALGLNFEAEAVEGALSKALAETWSGTAVATGTAGWFRMREGTDAGTAASSVVARLDGAIATSGAQMNLGSLAVTVGAPFVITNASFTLPKA